LCRKCIPEDRIENWSETTARRAWLVLFCYILVMRSALRLVVDLYTVNKMRNFADDSMQPNSISIPKIATNTDTNALEWVK